MRTNGHRWLCWVATGFAALGLLSGAAQAQDYPHRTVTLVVPYPPGGPTDALGRLADAAEIGESVGLPGRVQGWIDQAKTLADAEAA